MALALFLPWETWILIALNRSVHRFRCVRFCSRFQLKVAQSRYIEIEVKTFEGGPKATETSLD